MLNINATCEQPGVPVGTSKALWVRLAGQPVSSVTMSPASPAIVPVTSRRRLIIALPSSPNRPAERPDHDPGPCGSHGINRTRIQYAYHFVPDSPLASQQSQTRRTAPSAGTGLPAAG